MQPEPYNPRKHDVAGWFVCEYVHGAMAFWDGGLSRGQLMSTIPWAKSPPGKSVLSHATGIWSAGMEPLRVEDKFLDALPCMPLVGILGHMDTNGLQLAVTGCPSFKNILDTGDVQRSNGVKMFSVSQNLRWLSVRKKHKVPDLLEIPDNSSFEDELWFLDYHLPSYLSNAYLLLHKKLPIKDVSQSLKEKLIRHPTGILLRDPKSVWGQNNKDKYLRLLP